ncbi:Testis-expressed protein 19.2 [Fukomys damarensis]|uniref:Testis-expressed protein 19.2 n=1 Tax=Fukomys damarensis TaxID=885580 RepID=A0A091DXF8_FUKDA|nr:Testis-expressed protein 19.2 [Fukomys damarensis]
MQSRSLQWSERCSAGEVSRSSSFQPRQVLPPGLRARNTFLLLPSSSPAPPSASLAAGRRSSQSAASSPLPLTPRGSSVAMCPPVAVRKSREGMTYLYASWLYELKHGSPLEVCFTCFKVAFMDLKDMLESEDWDDEEWDPMELDEAEHEQAVALGPGPEPGPGPGPTTSVGMEEEYLDDPMVPTELEPQSAVPLGLGPEQADWTQALPWRFDGLPACNHWPSPPPPPKPVFPRVTLSPVEPMVLELGTMWPVEPAEAETWLLNLQVFCVVGFQDTTIYLRKMTPAQALRSPCQCWRVLLEPSEVWVLKLQEAADPHNLLQCHLSVLEKTQQSEQLFPAYAILQKKGFTIVSYSPLSMNEGHAAPASWFPTWGQVPGPLETGNYVENLAVVGVLALGELSCFQPFGPELEN